MPFYKERTVRRRHHGHCPEARAHHQQRVASTLDSYTLQCHCFSKKPWTLSNVEVDDLVEKNMLLDEKVALTLVKVGVSEGWRRFPPEAASSYIDLPGFRTWRRRRRSWRTC